MCDVSTPTTTPCLPQIAQKGSAIPASRTVDLISDTKDGYWISIEEVLYDVDVWIGREARRLWDIPAALSFLQPQSSIHRAG